MRTNKLSLTIFIALFTTAAAAFAQVESSATTETIVSGEMLLSVDKLRPGDSFDAVYKATIREGFHIGSADRDALYPAKLTVKAPRGITFDEPVFPKGERKAFEIAPNEKIPVYEGIVLIRLTGQVAKDAKPGPVTITATLDSQGCKGDQCYPPEMTTASARTEIIAPGARVERVSGSVFESAGTDQHKNESDDAAGRMAGRLEKMNPLTRSLLLYLGGLMLAFTPCVYPMIPVTFGYFSNQSANRQKAALLAAFYVLGIALTYSTLGVIAATTGGVFGAAMQSTPVLLGIAAVLVLLALSMFGLYELQPPAFVQSKASGRSGVLGALMMGLIFGVVAAPCVGPMVLGLLLLAAKIGNPVVGFFLFFPLALGIGTPLFFVALFSAKMPQPGMWMVAVKKFAGFLLLGVAAYFIVPIMPDDLGRYLVPLVILAAGVYLGCVEKSIKSSKRGAAFGKAFCGVSAAAAIFMLLPNGPKMSMTWEPYTPQKLTQAAEAGKPVMLDFTAKWCGVCRELEHGPFSDHNVIEASKRFTRLQVDGTDRNDKLMLATVKKYAVKGFPTIIFFDSKGSEVKSARVVGFVKSDELVRRMKSVE